MRILIFCGLCLCASPALAAPAPSPTEISEPSPKAITTESGLTYQVLKRGRGKQRPSATSKVTVHYTGWQASDGKKFDSSVDRDKPLTFVLNRVIKGWIEGLQQMRVGEKTRFWIPAHLAYGDKGHAGRPSGTLIFDIELLDILDVPKEIKTPNMAIPKRAKTTASGLTYKVLKRGKGKRHPETTDTVKVHYTGWQASDGRQFDSSETRGQPAILPLSRVIKGWTEGLQRMVVGERTRFWIPSHLAYGDSSRSLQVKGMLVFEIELLEIL